ncbi:MAG: hypothetical protein HVN35_11005 [Methanobacteriaceae archaeon]|nr:hypothetical protein [Methanobacteriaceae archaeon]
MKKKIAGIAHTAVIDEQTLDEKKIQFNEITDLKRDIKHTKEKYDSIIVPDNQEMKKIEELYQDIRDAETSLKAMGLKIKATPDKKMSGEIFRDGEKNSFHLEHESGNWTAHQSLKMFIHGVGEITVTSGSQDVQGMKEKLENLKTQYQELMDSYPTHDLSQLKNMQNKKESLQKDLKWLETQLNRKSKKGEDELLKEIITLENRIKSNWNKIPSESDFKECNGQDKFLVRKHLSEKINLMEEVIKQMQRDRQKLNEILENDRKTVEKTNQLMVELKTQLHGNNQRKDEIENRLQRLNEDGLSAEERESKLNQLSLEIEQKERAWKSYHAEIETKEIKPLKAFEGLKNRVEMLDEQLRSQEIKRAGMERELSILMAQSTDSTVIEEKLAQMEMKEKELDIDTQAIKLLYNLTSFYHEKTINQLSEPLETKVTQDLERLLGPKYSLKFDSKMKPRSVNALGEEAPLDILSFGTQEQVWCLFRLALGSILSQGEKQLVVLDDPLVNTDPVRMHHALEILEENSKNMQIIVVTCDIDKYSSLSGANFISMDEKLKEI